MRNSRCRRLQEVLGLLLAGLASLLPADDAQRIVTPHWTWPEAPAKRIVFLVNEAAQREPGELDQRFPIEAWRVPVSGSDYGNNFAEEQLLAFLARRPEALVIAASNVWSDLSPEAVEAVRKEVAGGLPLVLFERRGRLPEWPDLAPEGEDVASPFDADLGRRLGLGKRHEIRRHRLGQGTITVVSGFAQHYILHSAFLPQRRTYDELPAAAELCYTGVARILLEAAGWQPGEGELHEQWHDRFGAPTEAPRPGLAFRRWWRVTPDGKLADFGVELRESEQKLRLAEVTVAGTTARWQPVQQGTVRLALRDAEGRLLTVAEIPATAGQADLAAPSLVTKTCTAQLQLVVGAQVMDEQRVPLTLVGPHAPMPIIVWGRQTGSLAERWQYPRLRQLGINALAPVGKSPEIARMAALAGLRLVPTNVFVPSERTLADLPEAEAQLTEYAAEIAPHRPLGWSLADEPKGTDLLAWLERGRGLIGQHSEAPVGYCGVFLRPPLDVREFMQATTFLEAYSPLYLYTANLWRDSERSQIRDFRRDDSLVTAWTHYLSKCDHEPYARTVPWLWLFDGLDGISYFCSTRNFGILHDDLTTAPDSRWWAEEVAILQQGLAAQIRAMEREKGVVRLLYAPDGRQNPDWAESLRDANIAWQWLAPEDLAKVPRVAGEVLVALDTSELTPEQEQALGERVAAGSTLVAGVGDWGREWRGVQWPEGWQERLGRHQGVPATTPLLTGHTNGIQGWQAAGAETVGGFSQLGAARPGDENLPQFVADLLATPAVLRHTHGQGTVWNLAVRPDHESIARFLERLGVKPLAAQVLTAEGAPAPHVYLYALRQGQARVWGVIQDYNKVNPSQVLAEGPIPSQAFLKHGRQRWEVTPARLSLPAPAHLYDLRDGRYFGHTDTAEFSLDPSRPTAFAALPYRVAQVAVTGPADVRGGQALALTIAVKRQPATKQAHQVHLDFGGLADPIDLEVTDQATIEVPVPLDANGEHTIRAVDALSRVSGTLQVTVRGVQERPPQPEVVVIDRREELPAGAWEPWQPPVETRLKAHAGRLRERPFAHGDYAGQMHLSSRFSLENAVTKWRATYRVCNDWKRNKWPDKRMIDAPYLPGLGFTEPVSHTWYYNGYLEAFFDRVNMTRYALVDIRQEEGPGFARIVCEWDTPGGTLLLKSTLRPDDPALYQEFEVRPTTRFQKLSLRFRSYPAGFGHDGKQWIEVDPEGRRWAILGDSRRDRAYGQGSGAGAILVLPEEWSEWQFSRMTTLERIVDAEAEPLKFPPGTLDGAKKADPEAAVLADFAEDLTAELAEPKKAVPEPQPIRVHWVLWAFPDKGNADVVKYIREHQDVAAQNLKVLYPEE